MKAENFQNLRDHYETKAWDVETYKSNLEYIQKKNLKSYLKYLTDYYPRKQSSTNLSFILYDGPEIFFVTLHGLKKWPRRFLSLIYDQFVIICVT